MRRAYVDSCIVIYLIENVDPFSEQTRQFLARNGDALLCVSPLVRLEVIVKPLRESAVQLVADYEDFLAAQHWLAIDDSIFRARLPAARTPRTENLGRPALGHRTASWLHRILDQRQSTEDGGRQSVRRRTVW